MKIEDDNWFVTLIEFLGFYSLNCSLIKNSPFKKIGNFAFKNRRQQTLYEWNIQWHNWQWTMNKILYWLKSIEFSLLNYRLNWLNLRTRNVSAKSATPSFSQKQTFGDQLEEKLCFSHLNINGKSDWIFHIDPAFNSENANLRWQYAENPIHTENFVRFPQNI